MNGDWAGFWTGEPGDSRWLGLRQGTLLHEQFSPRPEGHRFGPVHFAFKLPAQERDAALARLKANQVPIHGPTIWGEGRFHGESYYFYDPDDNLLEFWFPI